MNPDPVLELLRAHRTVRRFRSDPVPDEVVLAAVDAARHASTSSHVQAYSLLRVRDMEVRAALAELCGGQAQVRAAGAFLVVAADQRRHVLAARRAGARHVGNLESFLVAVIDAALFAQNLALAFEAHGLGVCFIGGLRNRLPEVDRLLEVPDHVFPLFGLCAGTPAVEPPRRPRFPARAVLAEGRWPDDAEVLAAIDAFDGEARSYYERIGKTGRDWSSGLLHKVTRAAREQLFAYYRAKGACTGDGERTA